MTLLHNGNWKHSATEEGITVPGAVKLGLVLVLLLGSFFISGCDEAPLKPNTGITDQWEQVIRPDSREPITAMTYTGTGELLIAQHNVGMLLYSEDANGEFILEDQITLTDNRITELFSDTTTGFIYAGTFGGSLYRSTDFGGTWRDITPSFDPELLEDGLLNYCAGIAASPDYELFAAFNGHGIFYSTDFGTSWTVVLGPPSIHGVTGIGLTQDIQLYIGTQSEGILQGSSFAGVPFWTVTTGLTPHVTTVTAGGEAAYIGTDVGAIHTWSPEAFDETSAMKVPSTVMDLKVSPGGMVFAATERNGVWMVGDGTEIEFNVALFDTHTRTLTFDSEGYIYVGTESEGVFKSVFPAQFYESRGEQ